MNYMTTIKLTLAGMALIGATTTSVAAEDLDGKALYTAKLCMTCHGDEGKKPILPTYPKLNGQNKEYLIEQVKLIKDGSRSTVASSAMKAMIATLSDEEIAAISDYLSNVE